MGAKAPRKVKRRLKKSARRTIAALLMITALIVAAIPVKNVEAVAPDGITAPASVDELTEISGINVSSISSNAATGWLVTDASGTCELDPVYHLPVDLYDIDYTSTGFSATEAAVTGYNPRAIYVIDGLLPLRETIGYGAPTKTDSYTVFDLDVSGNRIGTSTVVDIIYKHDGTQQANPEIAIPVSNATQEVEYTEGVYRCTGTVLIRYIADNAFRDKTDFSKIEIPNYIVRIGNDSFRGCTNLQNISLQTALTSLGNRAFAGCSNLNAVIFVEDSSCTIIGAGAFANCKDRLTAFTFPSSIRTVGDGIFLGCTSLTNIEMSTASSGNAIGNFDTLGNFAFMNCTSLKNIVMNPNITSMGKGIFANCVSLYTVELTNNHGIAYPRGTFYGCGQSLEYVKITDLNTRFEDTTVEFDEMYDGFYLWGPAPTTASAVYTYAYDYPLTYYYVDGTGGHYEKSSDGYKFTVDASTSSGEVILSKFEKGTGSGVNVSIPSMLGPFTIVGISDDCFNKDDADDIATLSLPSTIRTIGNRSFYGMSDLQTVTIDTYGVSVGEQAFAACPSLEEVYFNQVDGVNPTTIGTRCFYNCPNLELISFRDDNFQRGTIFDVNVTTIGNEAFYTNCLAGDTLTIRGKIQEGYAPFNYISNSENKLNGTTAPYIQYDSGNPDNLLVQYNATEQGVTLLSYPSLGTVIGSISSNNYTVQDIVDRRAPIADPITQVQQDIINSTYSIILPMGIDSITNAKQTPLETNREFRNLSDTQSITINDVSKLPSVSINGAFSNNAGYLSAVTFAEDMTDIGVLPFYASPVVSSVDFSAETFPGTIANPYFWCENGLIFNSYVDAAGDTIVTLVEVLPGRGTTFGSARITSDETSDTTYGEDWDELIIMDRAFENCDGVSSVDLSSANYLSEIPTYCFYDCDRLKEVILPTSIDSVLGGAFEECGDNLEVTIPAKEVYIAGSAFDYVNNPLIKSYLNSAAYRYAKDKGIEFEELKNIYTVTFVNYDGTVLVTQTVEAGSSATPPTNPVRTGYTFTGWRPNYTNIYADVTCIAQYTSNSSTTTSSSSKTTSSSSKTTSSSSKTTSSSSTSSSSTSSSSSSTSSSSTIVSGTSKSVSGSGIASGTGSTTNKSNTDGNTRVVANTSGITDIGKISATVNGSTDSYVVKIIDSADASTEAEKALLATYGSLDAIRYLPMDISLYDSTGTTKITPIPEGVSVSITMPIPDDLAIYGGNARPASAAGGILENLNPRFTVISGIPCMTFTATHFSPYLIYVDTSNLSATGSPDATPVTGDPIHPKWFLVIGLAAIAIVLFLKRDAEDKLRTA